MIQKASDTSELEIITEDAHELFARMQREFTTPLNGIARRFADIPVPIDDNQYRDAANAFVRFLELPLERKLEFSTFIDPSQPKTHSGYEIKSKAPLVVGQKELGRNKDDKEFFHYNRHCERDLAHIINVPDRRVTDFFDAARPIYAAVEAAWRDIARAFDTEVPGFYSAAFPDGSLPTIYLRFLAYRPDTKTGTNEKGSYLANAHYDQAAWTLALAESKPGLRIGRGPTEEQLACETRPKGTYFNSVAHKPQNAFFFASAARGQQIPQTLCDAFPLGYHDVLQEDTSNAAQNVPRWAIVAFLWPVGGKFTPYDQAHPDAARLGFSEGQAASTKKGY